MMLAVGCAAVFSLGFYAVLVRRDVIGILAGGELMIGSANVLLLASGALEAAPVFGSASLLVLVIAAAEASIGLALLVTAFRGTGRSHIDEFGEVSG